MEDQRLILLVQQFPLLYDVQHEHYADDLRKQNAWEEIGGKLGVSAHECQQRWAHILNNERVRFEQEFEFLKAGTASAEQQVSNTVSGDVRPEAAATESVPGETNVFVIRIIMREEANPPPIGSIMTREETNAQAIVREDRNAQPAAPVIVRVESNAQPTSPVIMREETNAQPTSQVSARQETNTQPAVPVIVREETNAQPTAEVSARQEANTQRDATGSESSEESSNEEPQPSASTKSRKRKRCVCCTCSESIKEYFMYKFQRLRERREKDELDHYFAHIEESVRYLPQMLQWDAKKEISRVVSDLEYQVLSSGYDDDYEYDE